MNKSTITVDVFLDEQKIPEKLSWSATQSTMDEPQDANAMMLSFWDGKEKAALRIDLWTKDMMMDEMADFVYQNMMTMADGLVIAITIASSRFKTRTVSGPKIRALAAA